MNKPFDLMAALAETDRQLGLPQGFSAAQIKVESAFNPKAVSPAGAQGLAQVMPATLKVISQRLGRKLDPFNEADAVEIHREVMRENLAKFKRPDDALRAYNGGWDRGRWNNPETAAYVGKVSTAMKGERPVLERVLTAAIPSAQAAPAQDKWWEAAPLVTKAQAPKADDKWWESAPLVEAKSEPSTVRKVAGGVRDMLTGAVRGAGSIGATILAPIDIASDALDGKGLTLESNRRRRADMDSFMREQLGADTDSLAYKGGGLAAEIAGTMGVGGAAVNGLSRVAPRVVQAAPTLMNAIRTGGMTTGGNVAPRVIPQAVDMGTRMVGGAINGGISAGLINPEAADTGTVVGAILPPVAKVAGVAGNALGSLVRPFTNRGQDQIAGNALRQFAANPDDALRNLRNVPEMVPGSVPTTVAAAGDEGLAGLSRTLQSADPRYANELASRQYAQNAARTQALQEVAGNTGKLSVASRARDEATEAMRETVLDAAGQFPARPVLDSMDRLIAKPDNAGRLAQSALRDFRSRIAEWAPDGQIDARALYAIRKDINDILGGKLQGEAGNLRHASSQLIKVKELIDDAIDLASRRVTQSAERGVMPYGANIERAGAAGPYASTGPRPTWRGYLDKYSEMSVPIDQMKKLDEVMKAASTGTVDKNGNAILSAAKLNNYLRNNAKELQKELSPEQLDLLRRLEADLNASQLAATSGKAVGSNTVQNISGVNALSSLVGRTLGESTPVQATAGRAINWLYKKPDAQIMNKLGEALLNPEEAARLMGTPEGNALLRAFTGHVGRIGYRAAPALAAQ